MGALDGIRVVEAGLLVQGPQAAAPLGEWGADVDQGRAPGLRRPVPLAPVAPATRSAVLHRLQPREAQHHHRPAPARRSRGVPAPRRTGRRRHHQLQARHDGRVGPRLRGRWRPATRGVVYAAGSTFGPVGPDAHREGADLAAQAAGGLISTTGRRRRRARRRWRHHRRPHRAPEPRERRPGRAAGPRAHRPWPARRHLAHRRPDLGAGERVHALPPAGAPAGPANRGTRSIPGCTASSRRPTDGSPSSASPGRREPSSSRHRPAGAERALPQLLYWNDEKAELSRSSTRRSRPARRPSGARLAASRAALRAGARPRGRWSPTRPCGTTATSGRSTAPTGRAASSPAPVASANAGPPGGRRRRNWDSTPRRSCSSSATRWDEIAASATPASSSQHGPHLANSRTDASYQP